MYNFDSAYYGMNFFWWCFWIIVWVSFFSFLTPIPRRSWQKIRETPRQILLRRLANGEINEHEFESRKVILDRETVTQA